MKTNRRKAERLAKALFALGSDGPNRKCHRIEFKSLDSNYDTGELSNGGLCETALVDLIEDHFNRFLSKKPPAQEGGR